MSSESRPRKPKPSSALHSPSSSPKSQTLTLLPKMRRSLFKPFLLLLLSLSLIALYLLPSSNPSRLSLRLAGTASPKVYLYDLPDKFTYGVIRSYAAARGGPARADPAALKYPGHQHSGEWFLFADLVRGERPGSPVERVLDPEAADLFYVPFFSSLSLVVNQNRGEGVKEAYSDEAMQVRLKIESL